MSNTVNDLYALACYDLLEDNGLVLGILTVQQYLDLVNLTLQDFLQRACFSSLVQTQYVSAGTGRYTYPDGMMRVDMAFLSGVLLEPSTVQALNNGLRQWRTDPGLPTRWHADELPLKTIELALLPNDTGVYVPGPSEPDPPHAQTGWNVAFNGTTYTPDQHRDMTLIGPQLPAAVSALTDPLCFGSVASPTAYIPQDFVLGYLGFGVLFRIFSGDNELKNGLLASWCEQEYEEGVQLLKAIMGESNGSAQ